MEVRGSFHAHDHLISGEKVLVTQKIAGFVGSRTGFEVLEKR
jgi:hypothetical protein